MLQVQNFRSSSCKYMPTVTHRGLNRKFMKVLDKQAKVLAISQVYILNNSTRHVLKRIHEKYWNKMLTSLDDPAAVSSSGFHPIQSSSFSKTTKQVLGFVVWKYFSFICVPSLSNSTLTSVIQNSAWAIKVKCTNW